MAVRQAQLGQEFFGGAKEGKASNVEIKDFGDYTALVGYEWAVYAVRNKESGKVIHFRGWRGYSSSTSAQLTRLDLPTANLRVDTQPQSRVEDENDPVDVIVDEDLSWQELIEEFIPQEGNRQRVA